MTRLKYLLMSGRRFRRIAFSFSIAAAINALAHTNVGDAVLDHAVEVTQRFAPYLSANVLRTVALLIIAVTVYLILESRVGERIYEAWREVHRLNRFLARHYFDRRQVWGVKAFRHDLLTSLYESERMHCVLVSGYTMIYETERFILEAFAMLPTTRLQRMDIRILLLDPKSQIWQSRAEHFIRTRPNLNGLTVSKFRDLCEEGIDVIRTRIPGVKIAFYDSVPMWRLFVFDNEMFVSRYATFSAAEYDEGHLIDVAVFNSRHPMFRWLYTEFLALWKQSAGLSLRA